ncbi:MAG: dihydrodipicolinate synthase family protein, partial [Acidobacteriota bacterium]
MVYKSDSRETLLHFRTVARATNLPIMCYNNPVSYGVDITPEMFVELADEPPTYDPGHVRAALIRGADSPALPIDGIRVLRGGQARGVVLGGCLSLIASLVGTPYLPDLKGRILFVEETGEAAYRLDRMLNQMVLAGCLEGLSGLLIGQLTGCESPAGAAAAEEIVAATGNRFGGPVLAGLPVGHGSGRLPLALGVEMAIDAGEEGLHLGGG